MRLGLEQQIKFVEERRKAAEAALWQLPSVSVAGQAFLLSAGLNPKAEDWVQILVGGLGMFAAVATGAIVAFQSRRVTIFGRWVRHHVAGPVEADDLNEDLRNFETASTGRSRTGRGSTLFAFRCLPGS